MGFDIQRFVDQNIDREFICNICQDVLEDPLMISSCEHLYCSNCILDCIKVHGVCPQDRSPVSLRKLVQPIRTVKNLINKLKVRCNFDGCPQVLSLGELHNHLDKCEANPENQKLKCFCKKEFPKKDFISHKDLCLEYQKNELTLTRAQLSTYTKTVLSFSETMSAKVSTDSEIKFLYKQLKQSLSKFSDDYNSIEKSLLYISSKLLNDENVAEKDILSTVRYLKYGFEDISIATNANYDNCCHLISNNGFDYLYLCLNTLNNKHINRYIAQIVKNMSRFEDLMIELMNKKCIKMMLYLMNQTNDINTSMDSAFILSDMTLLGTELWEQKMPEYNRQQMLKDFKTHLYKWKANENIDSVFDSFKELFTKMASEKCTPELTAFYVWLLANISLTDPEKYFPMIESENGFAFLKSLEDCPHIENPSKRNLELILNKSIQWKEKSQNSSQSHVI